MFYHLVFLDLCVCYSLNEYLLKLREEIFISNCLIYSDPRDTLFDFFFKNSQTSLFFFLVGSSFFFSSPASLYDSLVLKTYSFLVWRSIEFSELEQPLLC